MFTKNNKLGFTLIEVIIVVAILSILMFAVFLYINPAQLTTQARDQARINDISNLSKAVELSSFSGSPSILLGQKDVVYVSIPSNNETCSDLGLPNISPKTYSCKPESTFRKVDGTGWVPINFTVLPTLPLKTLPIDPINEPEKRAFYTYAYENGKWEITATAESNKYKSSGTNYSATADGGDDSDRVEIGPTLAITPPLTGGGVPPSPEAPPGPPSPTIGSIVPNNWETKDTPTIVYIAYIKGYNFENGTTVKLKKEAQTTVINDPGTPCGSNPPPSDADCTIHPSVEISGSGFDFYSNSLLGDGTFTLPADAPSGRYSLEVINPSGQVALANQIFTVHQRVGKFWVGGSGNWSDTSHWATSPNGPGGASLPTSSDNVYFTTESFTGPGQTITIDGDAATRNLDFTDVANTPTLIALEPSTLSISGSLRLSGSMNLDFNASLGFDSNEAGNIISLAGKTIESYVTFNSELISPEIWILADAFNNTNGDIDFYSGFLDTNGKDLNTAWLLVDAGPLKKLKFGSSNITVTRGLTIDEPTTDFDAGTSTITYTTQSQTYLGEGGGLTYYNVVTSGNNIVERIKNKNTFNNLTINAVPNGRGTVVIEDDQIINGTLTINGADSSHRVFVKSAKIGTSAKLTASSVNLTNVDFQDITALGSASPFTGINIGDALGNTGITPTPSTTRYWVGNGGNWLDPNHWSLSSGGTPGAGAPLPQDDAVFNNLSITSSGQNITILPPVFTFDSIRLAKNIDFTEVLNSPTIKFATGQPASPYSCQSNVIYGSLTLSAQVTLPSLFTGCRIEMSNRSSATLTTAGKTLNGILGINSPNGNVILGDDLNAITSLLMYNGTFDANNKNVYISSMNLRGDADVTIRMGSGMWTLHGRTSGGVWGINSGQQDYGTLTVDKGTSTIKITNSSYYRNKTFYALGQEYNNLIYEGDGTSNENLKFMDNSSFNDVTYVPGGKINFESGVIQTINGILSANGTSAKKIIIRSATPGSTHNIQANSTSLSYIDVKDSVAGGAASPFICGATCTNSGNNTLWSF